MTAVDAVGVAALQKEPAGLMVEERGDDAPGLATSAPPPPLTPQIVPLPQFWVVPAFTQAVPPLLSGTQPDGQQTSALALWTMPNANAIRRRTASVGFLAWLDICAEPPF